MPTLPETKIVQEYAILLSNGMTLPILLEPAMGDMVTSDEKVMIFDLQPRKQFPDAPEATPAEHIVVRQAHIVAITSSEHLVKVAPPVDWSLYSQEFNTLPPQ